MNNNHITIVLALLVLVNITHRIRHDSPTHSTRAGMTPAGTEPTSLTEEALVTYSYSVSDKVYPRIGGQLVTVKEYQRALGIKADGVFGTETLFETISHNNNTVKETK